jgi:excisionase family DNA binding protein
VIVVNSSTPLLIFNKVVVGGQQQCCYHSEPSRTQTNLSYQRIFVEGILTARKQMVQLITNLSGEEFKEFLKDALKEIFSEQLSAAKQQLPEIMDINQAANFLKLKVTTLYEKTSGKLIPHFKKGNKLYFHSADLQEWIKQGKVKTQGEIESEAITFNMKKAS